jgi:hypothetical protein
MFSFVTVMKPGVAFLTVAGVMMVSAIRAEIWTHTNTPSASYPAISADGRVFVVGGTATYVSYDYGVTWHSNDFHGSAVAISASGSNIIAGSSSPGAIHTSTDAGATWTTPSAPPTFGAFNNVRQIASSSDANRLGLVLYGTCPIFTSMDGGVTWSTNNDSPVSYWAGIASCADGHQLVATSPNAGIWISTNYGANWFSALASNNVMAVASSADGSRLLGAAFGRIYVSSDFGATWFSQDIQNMDGNAAASSADGSRLAVSSYFGIFMSTNSGETWSNAGLPALAWDGVATAADGHRWMAHSGGSSSLYIGSSPPTPVLQVAPTNGNVSISWTVPSSPFVLQQATSLNAGEWSTVPDVPVMNPGTLADEVTIPTSNSCNFFRLSSP